MADPVRVTLLDATAFGIGRQQIALTLISHPAVLGTDAWTEEIRRQQECRVSDINPVKNMMV